MPRRKKDAPRIAVPKGEDNILSKKAMKNSEFAYWGAEPTWNPLLTESETQSELGSAFSWYNAMVGEAHKKGFLVAYAVEHFPAEAEALKRVPEKAFMSGYAHTMAIVARCAMRGAKLLDRQKEKLAEVIKSLAKDIDTSVPAEVVVEKAKPKDPKVGEAIALVNGALDDFGLSFPKKTFPTESMADFVLKTGISNAQRMKVHEHFAPLVLEFQAAISGKDKEIAEAYEGFAKKNLQRVYNWLTAAPNEDLVQSARKTRKPRKKKAKTAAQILKRFACKTEDTALKIKSIDPESILGAEQLWVFNTKTRRLGVYHAKDEKGLGISRKAITNYDEAKSVNKKIRKPPEVVPGVVTAGKVPLRHLLDGIRASATKMKCRIGADTLLLRVIK